MNHKNIGRVVHFREGNTCLPAIVVRDHGNNCFNLRAMGDGYYATFEMELFTSVPRDYNLVQSGHYPLGYSWHPIEDCPDVA